MALTNLVENLMVYTLKNGTIDISYFAHPGKQPLAPGDTRFWYWHS